MNPFLTILLGLLLLVLGINLLFFLFGKRGRSARTKGNHQPILRATRLMVSAPAFLVPAAMASLGTVFLLLLSNDSSHILSESPFGLTQALWQQLDAGVNLSRARLNFWLLLLASLCLAGQVGLLQSHREGNKPGSAAFLSGIRRYGLTILGGKLLLVAGVTFICRMVNIDSPLSMIFLVVPGLLLAPLPGAAALHPHNPLHALRDTLQSSTSDVFGNGRLVTIQLLFLLAAWILFSHTYAGDIPKTNNVLPPYILALGSSTLSYNHLPMSGMTEPVWRNIAPLLGIVFTVVCSAIFMTSHYLRFMDNHPKPEELKKAATNPA